MTQDEIIEMAKQAGLVGWLSNDTYTDGRWWIDAHEPSEELEAFAKLVAAKEREACAIIVDEFGDEWMCDAHMLSKIIRARGEA
jgi:hypothetical protein